jgi:hypothetical protein
LIFEFFIQGLNVVHPEIEFAGIFVRFQNHFSHLLVVFLFVDLHIFQKPQKPGRNLPFDAFFGDRGIFGLTWHFQDSFDLFFVVFGLLKK